MSSLTACFKCFVRGGDHPLAGTGLADGLTFVHSGTLPSTTEHRVSVGQGNISQMVDSPRGTRRHLYAIRETRVIRQAGFLKNENSHGSGETTTGGQVG